MNLDSKKLLINYKSSSIQRGQVLICKLKDDNYVALMLSEVIGKSAYNLMIISGYKAGLSCCYLPEESISKKGCGIDTHWLIKNWNTYGFRNSNIKNVIILDELDAEKILHC